MYISKEGYLKALAEYKKVRQKLFLILPCGSLGEAYWRRELVYQNIMPMRQFRNENHGAISLVSTKNH